MADSFHALGQHLRAQTHGRELLASYPDGARATAGWFDLARGCGELKLKEEDPRSKRPRERAMLRVAVVEFSAVVLKSDLLIEAQRSEEKLRVHVFRRGPRGERRPQAGVQVRVADGRGIRGFGATDARGIFEAQVPEGAASVLAEHEGHQAVYQD